MLSFPQVEAPTALTTDASATAVGAVLEQLVNGVWQPLAFLVDSCDDHQSINTMHLIVRFWSCTWLCIISVTTWKADRYSVHRPSPTDVCFFETD